MKYSVIRDVKKPRYAHPGMDAGIDLFMPVFDYFFVSEFNAKMEETNLQMLQQGLCRLNMDQRCIEIAPTGRVIFPAGVKFNVPANRALIANNKSGIATKQGLIFAASVIDNGYQNQVYISLINTSNKVVKLKQNQKVIQLVLHVIDNSDLEEVKQSQLYDVESKRGMGGFGHTGDF